MITSSSVSSDKSTGATAEASSAKKTEETKKPEATKKPTRARASDKSAVKVELSEEGRALANKKDAEAVKSRTEKEDDLVKFYAKRLVKATKELDKEEQVAAAQEEEESVPTPTEIQSPVSKKTGNHLPT